MPEFHKWDPSHSRFSPSTADNGSALMPRPRLLSLMVRDNSPLLLIAPTGYGKTAAALEAAQRYSKVYWVEGKHLGDAGGGAVAALSGVNLADSCVVVDACTGECASCGACDWWRTQSRTNSLLVVTGNNRSRHGQAGGRPARVLGPQHLLFDREEVSNLLQRCGSSCGVDVDRVLNATSGHPALAVAFLDSLVDGVLPAGPSAYAEWLEYLFSQLGVGEREVVLATAMLLSAPVADLERLGFAPHEVDFASATRLLPVLSMRTDLYGSMTLTLSSDPASRLPSPVALLGPTLAMRLCEELMRRHDVARAAAFAAEIEDECLVRDFLVAHSEAIIAGGHWAELETLLTRIPLRKTISDYRLLLIWALLEEDRGRDIESLAKARAAYVLASHAHDDSAALQAQLLMLEAYNHTEMWEEGLALIDELKLPTSDDSRLTTAQLEMSAAWMLLRVGRLDEALGHCERAADYFQTRWQSDDGAKAAELEAIVSICHSGDYFKAVRLLSPFLDQPWYNTSRTLEIAGNLGLTLTEVGRLDRAVPILRRAAASNIGWHRINYSGTLAQALAAQGEYSESNAIYSRVLAESAANNADAVFEQTSVYRAVVLRAQGEAEESLVVAEQAFERLSQRDYLFYRRLAAVEVAASLLALGDVRAARAWSEPVVAEGFGENQHHSLRAAMVLAECDRRDGDAAGGIVRIAAHRDHIISESSNWQIAMYVRAFPDLLGMFAAAIGVPNLPAHMLNMVLPMHAQAALEAAKASIDHDQWVLLGERLLGDQGFSHMNAAGQPLCRVRMFGGLEVSVAGRAIVERDWRKRKSRLLFAMLALKRGSETPRDEFFESLWPELDDERAKNNFYVAWSAMKAALMGSSSRSVTCPYIASARGRCKIVTETVRLDLDDFDEALLRAKEAESVGKPAAAIAEYAKISALYRGDLLPGDVYDDWFSQHRERYRLEFVTAMIRAAELLLETGDSCEALVYVRRGISLDPLREELYQLALSCHIAAGQRTAAVDTFMQCKSNLAEELGMDPSVETMRLYQHVLAMEECSTPDTYGCDAGQKSA